MPQSRPHRRLTQGDVERRAKDMAGRRTGASFSEDGRVSRRQLRLLYALSTVPMPMTHDSVVAMHSQLPERWQLNPDMVSAPNVHMMHCYMQAGYQPLDYASKTLWHAYKELRKLDDRGVLSDVCQSVGLSMSDLLLRLSFWVRSHESKASLAAIKLAFQLRNFLTESQQSHATQIVIHTTPPVDNVGITRDAIPIHTMPILPDNTV